MICGLVLHIADGPTALRETQQIVGEHPVTTAGDEINGKLPVVIECDSPAQAHDVTDWLSALSQVLHVDVAFVHLETIEDPTVESTAQASAGADARPLDCQAVQTPESGEQ